MKICDRYIVWLLVQLGAEAPFPGCLDCGANTLLYTNLRLTLYSVTDYIHNNTPPQTPPPPPPMFATKVVRIYT